MTAGSCLELAPDGKIPCHFSLKKIHVGPPTHVGYLRLPGPGFVCARCLAAKSGHSAVVISECNTHSWMDQGGILFPHSVVCQLEFSAGEWFSFISKQAFTPGDGSPSH